MQDTAPPWKTLNVAMTAVKLLVSRIKPVFLLKYRAMTQITDDSDDVLCLFDHKKRLIPTVLQV
jgi:hypothetical protein